MHPTPPSTSSWPSSSRDAFGNLTTLEFDPRDLYVRSTADARGNASRVRAFDFRVLAAREMSDVNDNLTEVYFDLHGRTAALP